MNMFYRSVGMRLILAGLFPLMGEVWAGAPEPPERWQERVKLMCAQHKNIECRDAVLVRTPSPQPQEFLVAENCPGTTFEEKACVPDYVPRVPEIPGQLTVIVDDHVTDAVGDQTQSLGKAMTVLFQARKNGRTVFFVETYQNSTPKAGCSANPADCPPEIPDWHLAINTVDEFRLRCYTNNPAIPAPRRDFICTESAPTSATPGPAGCPFPEPRDPTNPDDVEGFFSDDNFLLLQPGGPVARGLCKVFLPKSFKCQDVLAVVSHNSEPEFEKQCFPPEDSDPLLPYLGKAVVFKHVVVKFVNKASPIP